MSLEKVISEEIQKQIQSDMIPKIIAEQLEKCVQKSVDDIFGNWGDGRKLIENKLKEVLIPQIERFDYSKHIIKLDAVLTEVVSSVQLDHRKLLENFQKFMSTETPKEIKMSDLFTRYTEFVAKHVDTDNLEVNYDDGPHYEYVKVEFEYIGDQARSWSSFEHGSIVFECEKDESLNFKIRTSKYNDDYYTLHYDKALELNSLRNLSDFDIFLILLSQNYTHIIMDDYSDTDDVLPEKKPEPSWS